MEEEWNGRREAGGKKKRKNKYRERKEKEIKNQEQKYRIERKGNTEKGKRKE